MNAGTEQAPDGAEIVNDLDYISGDMGDYPLWQGVVDRSMVVINDLSAHNRELVAALEQAISRLDEWQFPNSQPIAQDIADDLRAALALSRGGKT